MQPLQGLTVVTLEHAIAAPFATRQLADLGAHVIKMERPGVGDFARGYDQRVRGLALHLGIVMALFATLPYGKFAHGVYRSAVLLKWAIEKRLPNRLQVGSE